MIVFQRVYSLTNYKISDANAGFLTEDFKFLMSAKAVGKIKNMKSTIALGTLNVYGIHKKKK